MSNRQISASLPKITVIGSINCDFTSFLDQFPVKNQTARANAFAFNVGGKGLNQAVAAARFGSQVSFVGCIGGDSFGKDALEYLNVNGVDTSHVRTLDTETTGTAGIFVSAAGENMIAVTPGANNCLSNEHIEQAGDLIESSDVIVVQLEVPLETVKFALSLARNSSTLSILNPAPALPSISELVSLADIITPNEIEITILCGDENNASTEDFSLDAVRIKSSELVDRGARALVTTLGANGCYIHSKDTSTHLPSHPVNVVDPTGAGDVFNGVLAVAVADGDSLEGASRLATAAAALSVEKETVCDAAPTRAEVEQFLNKASQ